MLTKPQKHNSQIGNSVYVQKLINYFNFIMEVVVASDRWISKFKPFKEKNSLVINIGTLTCVPTSNNLNKCLESTQWARHKVVSVHQLWNSSSSCVRFVHFSFCIKRETIFLYSLYSQFSVENFSSVLCIHTFTEVNPHCSW